MGFYAEEWVWSLPWDMLDKLNRGESVVVGSKVLRVCGACRTVIQMNKTFFGSMHLCA